MINYSVYMMSPAFSKEETPRAYAKNQVSEIWTLEKFARHIADHNGVFSRGTVKGVIADMCECLVEQLLNGNKIQLGELGSFHGQEHQGGEHRLHAWRGFREPGGQGQLQHGAQPPGAGSHS